MTILYVTDGIAPYVTGGMQAVARRQIIGLSKVGWDVHFVHSFRRSAREATDLPGTEHVLEYPYSRGLQRCSPWHYLRELKAYSRAVDGIVRRLNPELVYSEGPLVHESLTRSERPPIVFHPHGLDMFQNQMSLIRNLRARLLQPLFCYHALRANCVVSQGGRLTRILTDDIGLAKERIAVLPNAVPMQESRSAKARSGKELKCLFVGRDDPKKGFGLLRQAIDSVPGVSLDVVGMEGEDCGRVRWHGVVRDAEVIRGFYRGADVLVLPSYSEGMATVLLEAMQMGTPAIATDVGASSEVVINGKTGWLIEPGSASAVASAIGQAAKLNAEDYRGYSENCLQHIEENFQEQKVCERLTEILRRVAGN